MPTGSAIPPSPPPSPPPVHRNPSVDVARWRVGPGVGIEADNLLVGGERGGQVVGGGRVLTYGMRAHMRLPP
jgi:hypothetical protein